VTNLGLGHRRAASGFTLVEVVVALSVLALIMLATVTALRTFANTQSTLERHTLRVSEIRAVSSLLRDMIDASVMDSGTMGGLTLGGSSRGDAYLGGSSSDLVWKATVMFGENFGGTCLLRVSVSEGRLLLQWQDVPRNPKRADWSGASSRALVTDVADLDVAYRADVDGEWLSDWNTAAIPAQLRLRIRARERYWPDLIVALRQ
jgi:general secretion pathway protein J